MLVLRWKIIETIREQFQQNRNFRTNASQFYKELNGTGNEENISQNPGKAAEFSSDIWSILSTHNQNAMCLQRVRQELADVEKEVDIKVMVKSIRKCVYGIANWNGSGPYGVQGFWYKKMTNLNKLA